MAPDDDLGVDARVVGEAQDRGELMSRSGPPRRSCRGGAGPPSDPDGDILGGHGIEGVHIRACRPVPRRRPRILFRSFFRMRRMRPSSFPFLPLSRTMDLDGIALEGPGRVPGRDEDVLRSAALGRHEAEAAEHGHEPCRGRRSTAGPAGIGSATRRTTPSCSRALRVSASLFLSLRGTRSSPAIS